MTNEAIETIVVDVMLAEEVIINVTMADDSVDINLINPYYEAIMDAKYKGQSVVIDGVAIIPQQSKADVGLGNVDNTSDMDKPVSTAQATAIASAVAGEASLRGSADTALQGNIDAEASARATADTALDNSKVDKIAGKGLSTNDYTTAEKNKLAGIEAGAEVNDPLYTGTGTHTDGAMTQKATTDAIASEASARSSGDTALQTAINNEASARATADTALQTAIAAKADPIHIYEVSA